MLTQIIYYAMGQIALVFFTKTMVPGSPTRSATTFPIDPKKSKQHVKIMELLSYEANASLDQEEEFDFQPKDITIKSSRQEKKKKQSQRILFARQRHLEHMYKEETLAA